MAAVRAIGRARRRAVPAIGTVATTREPIRTPEPLTLGTTHGLSSRAACGKHQFRRHRQGRRAQEADLVHPRRAHRLPARHLHPAARASIPRRCARASRTQSGGVLGLFNMFSGGAVERMAIFALNIMPYISASIIIQLLTSVVPTLEALKKEGESGRKVLNQYTRYLTVVLAVFQSWGIAVGLQSSGIDRRGAGPVLRHLDGDHAHRRHHVPDVARRADHLARHRQRHLADHLRRHRREPADRDRRHPRARPSGRDLDRR